MQLTALITTLRHGEKDTVGELTGIGHVQARKRGIATEHLKGDVMLFHSGVNRVKDTIKSVSQYLTSESEADLDKFVEETNLQDYSSPYLHYLIDPKTKGEYFSRWDDIPDTEESRLERINKFLSLGSQSPEPGIAFSPVELARNVTRLVVTQIDFALITEPDFRTNFINGSHEPVICSFIHMFLNGFTKAHLLPWNGPSLGFAEGFEIKVYESRAEHKVVFKFRNSEREIDLSELRKQISPKVHP